MYVGFRLVTFDSQGVRDAVGDVKRAYQDGRRVMECGRGAGSGFEFAGCARCEGSKVRCGAPRREASPSPTLRSLGGSA